MTCHSRRRRSPKVDPRGGAATDPPTAGRFLGGHPRRTTFLLGRGGGGAPGARGANRISCLRIHPCGPDAEVQRRIPPTADRGFGGVPRGTPVLLEAGRGGAWRARRQPDLSAHTPVWTRRGGAAMDPPSVARGFGGVPRRTPSSSGGRGEVGASVRVGRVWIPTSRRNDRRCRKSVPCYSLADNHDGPKIHSSPPLTASASPSRPSVGVTR